MPKPEKTISLIIISLFMMMPFIFGMGSSGGSGSPEKIPVPVKKFAAVFIDQADIVTEAREISIEGKTFLEGKRGEGTYTIAFENIQNVNFLMNDGRLNGVIKMRDGSTQQLILNKNQKAFGRTSYGTFQISLGDIRKVTLKVGNGR